MDMLHTELILGIVLVIKTLSIYTVYAKSFDQGAAARTARDQ